MARRVWACGVIVALGVVAALVAVGATGSQSARADTYSQLSKMQKRLLSGFASLELQSNEQSGDSRQSRPDQYFPRGSDACATNLASNIRVNQACLNVSDPDLQGRGQSQNETFIAQDPSDTNNMVATFNDYRRGDGNCGGAYSTDKGRTWNDTLPPMSFTRGKATMGSETVDFEGVRQYWQAGGDTSVAFDTKGNAYFSCQVFNRGDSVSNNPDQSSAMVVFRSTQNHGGSWNFPARYVTAANDVAGSGTILEDKQLLTVDNNENACPGSQTTVQPGSSCTPFQDRIYVTWTEFAQDGSAYIWEAYSDDYGESFSARHLVSGNNTDLCVQTFGAGTGEGQCNENQFSDPFVGPDGALYVAWANFNNAVERPDNRNQILLAKSVDGGNTFSTPVKVSDYYDLPDCATYQQGKDAFRSCVPEKNATADSFFRATNYPSGAVDPTDPSRVVVTFGSYINRHSNESNGCVPTGFNPATGLNLYTGVKTPGACNNDILRSVSTDGGATFDGTTVDPRELPTATTDPDQALSDQWFQWMAFNKHGRLATSYYDRQYGPATTATGAPDGSPQVPSDEATGFSDFSLSSSGDSDFTKFNVYRVTSDSMPPPTQFEGSFWGDYTGMTADTNAYPIWSDTRNPELLLCPDTGTPGTPPQLCAGSADNAKVANDQDAYVAALPVSGP